MLNGCCTCRQDLVNFNTANHLRYKQTKTSFHCYFYTFVPWCSLVTVLTIELSLANSNNDDRHGEFSCLSWTRRTNSQLSLSARTHTECAFVCMCVKNIRHPPFFQHGYISDYLYFSHIDASHATKSALICKRRPPRDTRDRDNNGQDEIR